MTHANLWTKIVVGCFVLLLALSAHAQIAPCGGSCSGTITAPICITFPTTATVTVNVPCTSGDLDISVSVPTSQSASVVINVYAANYTFRDIKVRIPNANSAVALSVQGAGASGSIASINSITKPSGSGELWIGNIIAQSIGSGGIAAVQIDTVRATTGDIEGPITATGSPTGGLGQPGNIRVVETVLGDVLGDVIAENGQIDGVTALNGTIGSVSYTPYIAAKQNIQRVEAREVWADIDATFNGGNASDSQVWRVAATNGGFHGFILARRIDGTAGANPGVFVSGGDFDADMLLTDALRRPMTISGTLPSNRFIQFNRTIAADTAPITFGTLAGLVVVEGNSEEAITVNGAMTGILAVGGNLSGPVTLGATGVPGLIGQIIVNGNNNTSPSTWTGDIKPAGSGSTALATRPYYSNLASTLGGGAVGLAPFHLHGADCTPANTPTTPPSQLNAPFSRVTPVCLFMGDPCYNPATEPGFVLRFYGPVTFGTGVLPVFVLKDGADPTINYAQFMTATIENNGRDIRIRGDGSTHLMSGRYRVRPLKNTGGTVLSPLCDDLLTTSDVGVDPNFEYVFDLLEDCNRNGRLDSSDLAIIGYDAWPHEGTIDACEPAGVCNPDYTLDGNVDQSDVDCLVAWVAGDRPECAIVSEDPFEIQNPDFNGDGNVDQTDVSVLITTVAGGPCP